MTHSESLWMTPPPRAIISPGEIHVWRASLEPSASSFYEHQNILSPDEQERAARFHFEVDRGRFVAARGILRTILGYYLEQDPAGIRFEYGKNGKPAISATQNTGKLCFNLGHSENLALLAVTRSKEIGIDVEYVRPVSDLEGLAKRFFAVEEYSQLCALPADLRLQAFFNCWTRKEAYVKARGDGLTHPLDQFVVTLVPGEPAHLSSATGDPEISSKWMLRIINPGGNYVGALAIEGLDYRIAYWECPGRPVK